MKHLKRICMFTLALVLCCAVGLLLARTLPAKAATIVDSGTCGDNLTWTLDSDGLLTISGTGAMKGYSSSGFNSYYTTAPWGGAVANAQRIKTVVMEPGVTSIGEYAFEGCRSLTSVTIPDGVTSIGAWAFFDCTSLTSVTIPDSVSSIGEYAFRGCTGLTGVYITDLAAWCRISFADSYAQPLNYAHNLYINGVLAENITIPDSVMSIGSDAFYGCTSLTSVTIPDSVTSIGSYSFSNCRGLTSVTFPASLTTIGENAFRNCPFLRTIHYNGTKEQWKKIEILNGNEALLWAEILYTPHSGNHVWDGGTVIREATCVKSGLTRYTCTVEDCGATEERETPATGVHAFGDWANVLQPVCGVPGADIRMCIGCGKIEVRTLPATGEHSFSAWTVTKAPTCRDKGLETHTCAVCGEIEDRETAPTGAHTFGDWTVTKAATATEEGEETRTCSVCGKTETRAIPKVEKPAVTAETIGDVDGDGSVTASDARLALRAAVGLETFDKETADIADADRDKKITASDARLILRAAVGLENRKNWLAA